MYDSSAYVHGLAPARRADQQDVVGAGGRDLEGALGVRLAADVGEVEIVRRGPGGRWRGGRGRGDGLAAEEPDRLAERRRREDAQALDGARLGRIVDGDDEGRDAVPAAGERDGEGAAHGLDLAVERELADDREGVRRAVAQGAGGGEDAEGDRQIEGGALLAEVGGREVHGDAVVREGEAGVADRGADALAALATLTEPGGTTTFTWDARDRLIGVEQPGILASFAYAFGRRLSKTVNGVPTQYLYDGLDVAQQFTPGETTSYLRSLAVDELLGLTTAEGSVFPIADALGSTLALTDASRNPTTEYSYAPFGATAATNPGFPNPFQFTGRENDGLAGLYYSRARYYHPGLHRFLEEDPAGLSGSGSNLYVYVGNSPASFVDRLGLEREQDDEEIVLACLFCRLPEMFSRIPQALTSLCARFPQACASLLRLSSQQAARTSIGGFPVARSAVGKLEKVASRFGTTSERILAQALEGGRRFIDKANNQNVNIYVARPDGKSGFVRITLDPTQTSVVSAGLNRARDVFAGIRSGRLIPLE